MKKFKISDSAIFSVICPVCIAVLFLFLNYCFINWDNSSVNSDYHLFRGYQFYSGTILDSYRNLRENPFPPLAYMVSSLFWYMTGFSYKWGLLSFQVFSLIFILSMYGIGYKFGGRWGAVCTGFLAAASPYVMNYSRLYFLDFPQTAMTALSFWLLLKTENFSHRKYSILFGIVFALSMMTKWSSLIFLIFPVLWLVFPHIIKSRKALMIFAADLLLMIFLIWRSAGYLQSVWGNTDDRWLSSYFVNIFLPVVLFSLMMQVLGRKLTESDGEVSPLLNFSLSMVFPVVITTLWTYAAAKTIASKIYTDSFLTDVESNQYVLSKVPSLIFGRILLFFETQFNYAPILMVIGLIFLFFVKPEQRYRLLVLPLSLVTAILIFIRIGFPDSRYFISFIIFTAPLATYWIERLLKSRKYIILCLIVMSILSLTGWIQFCSDSRSRFFLKIDRQPLTSTLKGWFVSPLLLTSETPGQTYPCLADVVGKCESSPDVINHRYIPCVIPVSKDFSFEDFMLEGINQGKHYFIHNFDSCEALFRCMEKIRLEFQEAVIFEPLGSNYYVKEIAEKMKQYSGKDTYLIHRFPRGSFNVYLIILDDTFDD